MTNRRPSPPEAVRWIARKLQEAGHETWTVGGAVRDALIGRPSEDWDLATHARPGQVQKLFRTVPIGVDHGTVGILRGGVLYEITTFRQDVETDGRHAVVRFADSIADDLARRDFTINAIAWHPLREELFDPYEGRVDLEAGLVRTVGLPEERFGEDYLRILRALRFAGRFSFAIEDGTWAAMCANVESLPGLSAERIREELLKVLDQDARPSVVLDLYARCGALRVLYPELEALRLRGEAGPWKLILGTVDELPRGRPGLRLAALLRELDPTSVAQLLSRLRLSNVQVDETAHRCAAEPLPDTSATDVAMRRWLARTGPQRVSAVARLDLARARAEGGDAGTQRMRDVVGSWRRLRAIRSSGVPLAVGDLALTGRDLIRMGYRPGPRFGDVLDALLEQVLEDPSRNVPEVLQREAGLWLDGPSADGAGEDA